MVEFDDGRSGIRRVKAENSALHIVETRSRRCCLMPPIRDQAFSSCVWRRAVLKLDAPQQGWIKHCYGYDLSNDYQIEICKYIWVRFEKEFNGVKLQNIAKRHIVSLVWLAVQDLAAKTGVNRIKSVQQLSLLVFYRFIRIHGTRLTPKGGRD